MEIRGYQPRDQARLYEICLRTGDSGGDATGLYADPSLLGHVYVGPYLALAPALAFVLAAGDGEALGYVLGARDTDAFTDACEESWWPALRRRYPDVASPRTPDERLIAMIHHPPRWPRDVITAYPSHLHIDLLPEAQGRGYGRALIERLLRALSEAGSPGVHLGVARANTRAVGFYRRLGFVELGGDSGGLTMGLALRSPEP